MTLSLKVFRRVKIQNYTHFTLNYDIINQFWRMKFFFEGFEIRSVSGEEYVIHDPSIYVANVTHDERVEYIKYSNR